GRPPIERFVVLVHQSLIRSLFYQRFQVFPFVETADVKDPTGFQTSGIAIQLIQQDVPVDIGQYNIESTTGNQINGTASRDNVAHPIQYLVFRGTGRTDGVVVNGPHQRRTLFGSQNGEDT